MYGSSKTGWRAIDLGYRVAFTAGTGAAPEQGESLTASAVSGTVIGHYLTSGTWAGGDAAGVLVLSYAAAGRYTASAVLLVDSDNSRSVTISAVPAQQSLGTGTEFSFSFTNHNFFGLASLVRMYGCSGVGKPFEFDGSMFVELDTGVTGSDPILIVAHQNQLFVGYPEGSISYSGTGTPRSFAVIDGAGEITIGDTLTGMVGGYKNTLFFFGRNLTAYLVGTSNTDYQVRTLSDEAGAMAHTTVLMDQPTCLDDRGIRNTVSTDEYGDFSIATISAPIRPLLDYKRDGGALPVAATRIRRKSQYRVWFSDGDCIVMNYVRRRGRLSAEYTRSAYDVFDADGNASVGVITSVCSVEDSDGRERVFFTMAEKKYVYEMDRGNSFDGYRIPYFLRLPYNDFQAPHIIKRYRKLLVEVSSTFESTFSVSADFDDDGELGEQKTQQTVLGPSSFWTESDWDAFYWNSVPIRKAEQRIHGRGRNLSVALFSIPEKIEESHVVSGVTVLYNPRRMKR